MSPTLRVRRQRTVRHLLASLALLVSAALGATACQQSPTWQPGTAPAAARSPTAPATTGPASTGTHTITVIGSGDVLLHPDLWRQAHADALANGGSGYDFGPLFSGVRGLISSADLAVCHLETPVAAPGGPFSGYPRFSVPPQVIPALADLGYDTCSTASNHSLDQGQAGIKRTLDDLDAAGIHHAGSYRSKADHDTVNMLNVKGVKVAQLSYTFGFNGLRRPAGRDWVANLIDPAAILAEAHRARSEGAAIVIVSLHWGTEYRHSPNSQQLSLAKKLLSSPDVDLILGCHAHVVQPIEEINGKWVVYGMGNEVAHHANPINDNREGVLARFTFTETSPGTWRVTDAEAVPVWMSMDPKDRLVDLATALADPSVTGSRRAIYQGAYDRIRGYLLARGASKDGLVLAGS